MALGVKASNSILLLKDVLPVFCAKNYRGNLCQPLNLQISLPMTAAECHVMSQPDIAFVEVFSRLAAECRVIQDGSVQEEGTHQQLLDKGGVYGNLVRRQLQNPQAQTLH